jgi:hypothetical protein
MENKNEVDIGRLRNELEDEGNELQYCYVNQETFLDHSSPSSKKDEQVTLERKSPSNLLKRDLFITSERSLSDL